METEKKKESGDIHTSIIVTVYFFVFGGLAFFIAATIQKSFVPIIPGFLCWLVAVGVMVLTAASEVAKKANEDRDKFYYEFMSRREEFKSPETKTKIEEIFGKENER